MRIKLKNLAILSLVALSLLVGINSVSASLEPVEEWNETFGGTDYDCARAVQQTTDGGYVLAVDTESYGAGGSDVWLIKTDSNGNKQWDKTFGVNGDDYAMAVQQTTDGGYILAGSTESYGAGGSDAWLIKTDSNGNKQWDKTFGGTGYDHAMAVQQTTDGGYVLAGGTESYGAGRYDAWLIKTDSSGNKQWDKTFGGTGYDHAMAVQQTTDGGYVLAGDTRSYLAGGYHTWLVKTDSSGNKQWDKTFGDTEYASAVQQTTDGGYIIAGAKAAYVAGGISDAWLVKTDSNGNKQWDKTFGGTDTDQARAVQQTTDGGYIIAGFTSSYGAGGFDAWLVKILDLIPGDLLFGAGVSITGHVGMYIGNGQVIESHGGFEEYGVYKEGVVTSSLDNWPNRYMWWAARRVVTADEETRGRAINFSLYKLGQPFEESWWKIVVQKNQNGDDWYCSELLWAAYL